MSVTTLDSILEGRRSQPQQLIEVLQDVQDQYGYVPEEAMKTVARELGLSIMEVYRVVNFYKAFSLKPKGKNVITICTGTACHVRGADLLLNQAQGQLNVKTGNTTPDGIFTLECVNCVGACAVGPVVIHNGTYKHHMNPGKLRKAIDQAGGTRKKEASHGKTQAI
jgi:NADH:ubiquinone oxidoreductase subunit E